MGAEGVAPEPAGPQITLGQRGSASGLPLTAVGQAELEAYKVEDNPWFRCISRTPPWLFSGGVRAHRFTWDGDILRIRHEINDVDRTIYVGMTEHPADTEPSHLGHSIGWYEGETLVVDTAYFSPAEMGKRSRCFLKRPETPRRALYVEGR